MATHIVGRRLLTRVESSDNTRAQGSATIRIEGDLSDVWKTRRGAPPGTSQTADPIPDTVGRTRADGGKGLRECARQRDHRGRGCGLRYVLPLFQVQGSLLCGSVGRGVSGL